MLKDIFGFAEHLEKGTYGLGYNLTLTRNRDNAVLNKDNAINNSIIKINIIDCSVPYYTPSLGQTKLLIDHIVKKMPTQLRYIERSVFVLKEVDTQKLWKFELGTQKGINDPIWTIVGFQQCDRQHDQNLNNDFLSRAPVTSAQCIIGTKNFPDSAILLNYIDDEYSQGQVQIKEAFRALTQDGILQPSISDHDFGSYNEGNFLG